MAALLRERVAREAAARVQLVGEDALLDTGIVAHDAIGLLEARMEERDPAHAPPVDDRSDDRHEPLGAQRVVAPAVLPDDLVRAGLLEPRPGFEDQRRVS